MKLIKKIVTFKIILAIYFIFNDTYYLTGKRNRISKYFGLGKKEVNTTKCSNCNLTATNFLKVEWDKYEIHIIALCKKDHHYYLNSWSKMRKREEKWKTFLVEKHIVPVEISATEYKYLKIISPKYYHFIQ